MAPPSAIHNAVDQVASTGIKDEASAAATHEPGLTKSQIERKGKSMTFPAPPQFDDKYREREYLKGRLALAFRIFAKEGFDEGVAGHITLRVRLLAVQSHIFILTMLRIPSTPPHSGSILSAWRGLSSKLLTSFSSTKTEI
jgi:hypothetical protein